jgi:hypothetical protein
MPLEKDIWLGFRVLAFGSFLVQAAWVASERPIPLMEPRYEYTH